MSGQPRVIAGAMSGTSADGIDVALTQITGRGTDMQAKLLLHHARPYSALTRSAIFEIRDSGAIRLQHLAEVGRQISLTYALAVNEALSGAGLRASDLSAVAAHGQTLYHDAPDTIQWLDPALLAAEVGCAVVSDFRRADLAAGGQGAPLVPFADYVLFRDPAKSRVLLNIGGIANFTWLKAGATLDDVIAFDTGPGNCISDHLCRSRDPAGQAFDEGGRRAMRGRPQNDVIDQILRDAYFRQPPPKSTDGPAMIRMFEDAVAGGADKLSLDDLLATACHVTVRAIAEAVRTVGQPDELLVSGGGIHNQCLMDLLRDAVPVNVMAMDACGIPSAAKEAVAFALLGAATLDGLPSNVPSVTGAKRPVVLGSITPHPTGS